MSSEETEVEDVLTLYPEAVGKETGSPASLVLKQCPRYSRIKGLVTQLLPLGDMNEWGIDRIFIISIFLNLNNPFWKLDPAA